MKKIFAPILLGAAVVAPSASHAGFFSIDDTLPGDVLKVSANDFEGGLFINGAPFQHGLHSPAEGIFPESAPLHFSGSWIDLGASTPGGHTVIFREAGSPMPSDILSYFVTTGDGMGHIEGFFASDTDGVGLPEVPIFGEPVIVVEDGKPFSLPGTAFLSASVTSDVDGPPVPEVQTYASLFGAALIGARVLRRKLAAK